MLRYSTGHLVEWGLRDRVSAGPAIGFADVPPVGSAGAPGAAAGGAGAGRPAADGPGGGGEAGDQPKYRAEGVSRAGAGRLGRSATGDWDFRAALARRPG